MQQDDITIRLLADCPEHIPLLAAYQYEAISRHWIPNATVSLTEQRLATHLNRDQLPLTLVALYAGKPIGMVSLRITDGIQPELTPWLGSLIVAPEFRHLKVGRTLISAVIQKAQQFGFEQHYLLAFDATIPSWYARLGWQTIMMDQLFGHPVTVMHVKW